MELFSTDRLTARRLVLADAEGMLAIYGDPEGMRFVGDGRPLELEHCEHWVDVTDRNFEKRGYGMVALVEKATGQLIGCGGVVHPNQQEEPEVKYAFRRDQWGQGFATEAVGGFVGWARQLGIGELMATVDPRHEASQSVLRKSGFARGPDRVNDDGSLTEVWVLGVSRP